jgi:hypothetical protein
MVYVKGMSGNQGKGRKKKRCYISPAIKSEEIFERNSLACGKITGSRKLACRTSPKNS